MDFNLSEAEQEVAGLARQILGDRATNEHLKGVEASGTPYDADLWRELAGADLLGLAVPEESGGSDAGFLALCLFLEEVGRAVAPVPAYAALVLGALPLAQSGDEADRDLLADIVAGERIVTAALAEYESSGPLSPTARATGAGGDAALTGVKAMVPYAAESTHLLVAAAGDGGPGLWLVEAGAEGLTIAPQITPDRQPYAEVRLASTPARPFAGSDGLSWLVERATAARCMMQLGVVERALEMTGAYSRERVQFDRPIGSFQAVHQRAADAYIQVEAIRLTAWEAVWRLSRDLPATEHVAIAKFLAADGGQFASYACQHLHGGVGIDVDYPLHRYFLWAVQLEHELGSARHQLDFLGRRIAEQGLPEAS
jgi:3-oxocholest-4-en-26-oyl-CoA dehydrogenase beta subunit